MNNKKTNYNKDISKTEFLFESDAEKAVLNEALKPKKKKLYKRIILNTFIITFLLLSIFIPTNNYKIKETNKLNASVSNVLYDKTTNERLNSYSNNLKEVNNDYNKKYEILVNKANPINSKILNNYKLVNVKDNMYYGIKLEKETYQNYLELKKNLLQRGYYINIKEGYRPFNQTKNVYNNYALKNGEKYAEKHINKPGFSEHNTGLAFNFIISTNKKADKNNIKSEEYKYLENIAYIYGFIIRYPKEKEKVTGLNYEADHLRYVGKDLAKYLYKNNLTLEEYYN